MCCELAFGVLRSGVRTEADLLFLCPSFDRSAGRLCGDATTLEWPPRAFVVLANSVEVAERPPRKFVTPANSVEVPERSPRKFGTSANFVEMPDWPPRVLGVPANSMPEWLPSLFAGRLMG